MDADDVKDYIRSVDGALGVGDDRKLRVEGRTLTELFDQEFCDEEGVRNPLLRLPPQFLDAAAAGFRENHLPWLTRLLMGWGAYGRLLAYARKHDLIQGEFGRYMAQTKRHRDLIRDDKTQTEPNWFVDTIQRHVDHIENQIKGGRGPDSHWAFKAIFQKALVRLGRVVAFEHASNEALGGVDDLIAMLEDLDARMVLLVGAPLADSQFRIWDFVATNPGGGKIKVAKSTENRIFHLLSLWYYAQRKLVRDVADQAANDTSSTGPAGDKGPSADAILREFVKTSARTKWPNCDAFYKSLYEAFDSRGFHGKKPEEVNDRMRKRAVNEHFALVLKAGVPELDPHDPHS